MNEMFYTKWATLPFKDENITRLTYNYQGVFGKTAEALLSEGEPGKAYQLLDKCLREFPDEVVPYGVFIYNFPGLLAQCGQHARAKQVAEKILSNANKKYYKNIDLLKREQNNRDYNQGVREALYSIQQILADGKSIGIEAAQLEQLQIEFDAKRKVYGELTGQ